MLDSLIVSGISFDCQCLSDKDIIEVTLTFETRGRSRRSFQLVFGLLACLSSWCGTVEAFLRWYVCIQGRSDKRHALVVGPQSCVRSARRSRIVIELVIERVEANLCAQSRGPVLSTLSKEHQRGNTRIYTNKLFKPGRRMNHRRWRLVRVGS